MFLSEYDDFQGGNGAVIPLHHNTPALILLVQHNTHNTQQGSFLAK